MRFEIVRFALAAKPLYYSATLPHYLAFKPCGSALLNVLAVYYIRTSDPRESSKS
jgi:hypothetical protein